MVVANFTPVSARDIAWACPSRDSTANFSTPTPRCYGGSDFGNGGGVMAEPVPWMGRPYSLPLRLPPLGVLYFKPAAKLNSTPAQRKQRRSSYARSATPGPAALPWQSTNRSRTCNPRAAAQRRIRASIDATSASDSGGRRLHALLDGAGLRRGARLGGRIQPRTRPCRRPTPM